MWQNYRMVLRMTPWMVPVEVFVLRIYIYLLSTEVICFSELSHIRSPVYSLLQVNADIANPPTRKIRHRDRIAGEPPGLERSPFPAVPRQTR